MKLRPNVAQVFNLPCRRFLICASRSDRPIANRRHGRLETCATSLRAFTLLEVLLAVVIAAGLMVVALSYYQRAADLRSKLLEESERLATVRLLMDRLSSDLRTAFAEPRQGFSGTSDSLRFVHAGTPSPLNLADGALKLVTYGVVTNADGTNAVVIGFNRVEAPIVEFKIASTNAEPLSFNGGMDIASQTNQVVEPLTRAIRFAHFRYFDGASWRESWSAVELPLAVEASFGAEPISPEDDEYPYEVFRRVIFVPAGIMPEDPDDYLFPATGSPTMEGGL